MTEQEEKQRAMRSWLRVLICVVLGTALLFTLVLRPVRVDGPSMRETLQDGDLLLAVNPRLSGGWETGDLAVVRVGEEIIIKRVIATEGQSVDIDFDTGTVLVDGAVLAEPYVREPTWLDEGMAFPLIVPEGSLFLMGDNRNDSMDSRHPDIGPVDARAAVGKAVLLVLPGKTAELDRREWSRTGILT